MKPRVRVSLEAVIVGLAIVFSGVFSIDCASAPAAASAQAKAAWRGTQVIKVLDLLRDAAVDANAQTPPLISTEDTRKIVLYHRSAIDVTHAAPSGWALMLRTGLDELLKDLPGRERDLIEPYVRIILAVLGG